MPILIYPGRPNPRDRRGWVSDPPQSRPPGAIAVTGMQGLGDCIYSRAFIKTLARTRTAVYVSTPWPELLSDLRNVYPVRVPTHLRTQAKNMARSHAAPWTEMPRGMQPLVIGYGATTMRAGSLLKAMQRCFQVEPSGWDLPIFTSPVIDTSKPIAVIRPATLRTEWRNAARNPNAEYIAHVARELMNDYHVVSIADLADGAEWLDGAAPPAHTQLHRGELPASQMLGLIASARLVVGGVGFIVPACIATHARLVCILGGNGEHNRPDRITDPRMDLSHVQFITPDRYCQCAQPAHRCDKTITNFAGQWQRARDALGV